MKNYISAFHFTKWRLTAAVSISSLHLLGAATLQVGPGKQYAAPCAAFAQAASGDIVEIDSGGNYAGDVCAIGQNNLTIRGMNGRAAIPAAGQNAQGKAIWVTQGNNLTIENIEFYGASVPDQNGAGIRAEGTNLTIRNCYFHDNQMGLLAASNSASQILVEKSEFGHNGIGDGYTHNIYINHVGRLIFQFNYSHDVNQGQLVKTRAAQNYILYNRLTDENGSAAYEIGVPNGGLTYIIGNLVEQSPNTSNSNFIDYMQEGPDPNNPSHQLFVVNNTFVNDYANGGTFVGISSSDSTPAVIKNNIFWGPGTVSAQPSSVLANNFTGNPLLVNRAAYDYHLQASSPAIGAGADPGSGAGYTLTPVYQYVHPSCGEARITVGVIDIGAYEYGGSGAPLSCSGTSSSANLYAVSLNPSTVTGGQSSTGTATLDRAAPAGGASVALSSSNTSIASTPSSVAIPAGSVSAAFTVTTAAATGTAAITATYAGVTKSAVLKVNAPQSTTLSTLVLASTSVTGGTGVAGNRVTLTANAPAGGAVVSLSSLNPSVASLPGSVTIPSGAASATFTIGTYTVSAAAPVTISASFGGTTRAAVLTVNPNGGTGAPISIWSNSPTPGDISDPDQNSVELGLKFQSDVAGLVTGVRFYKGPYNTGVHTGTLWSATGIRLASVTFTGETATGWQQASFTTPVSIVANTTYVISYHSPLGRYSADNNYFSGKGATNGPLHALMSGVSGPNGVYQYGSRVGFPTSSYEDTNYWVDIVFQP